MKGYDLIIVGAGIMGAWCADDATAAGMRVAIIEPATVGGGATACAMGHLVAMDDDPAELALARLSLARWDGLADLAEAEFSRCGTLWVAENAAQADGIAARVARILAAGGEAQALNAQQLREVEPALAPDLYAGMLVPSEAVVYPPRVAQYLVRRACARGAVLFAGRAAHQLAPHRVTLDDGDTLHGPILVATGCALPQLLPELPVLPRKGHLLITDRYPGRVHHQVLELGYADSAHGTAASSVAFNVQPRPTGQVLVGSSREFDAHDAAVSPPMLARMLQRAFRFMPMLAELQAIRAWTGFRPATPDGRPYLGAVPGRADLWVAAGHEGLGITTAPGSARLLLDLILGRTPVIDPLPYAPARVLA